MDAGSIISSPDFRIITTLKHIYFNEGDLQELPLSAAIERWNHAKRTLLPLHVERLHRAAQACEWAGACDLLGGSHALHTIKQALASTARGHPEPAKGFCQEIRVRLLVDRNGDVEAQGTLMGTETPLRIAEGEIARLFPPPPELAVTTSVSETFCSVTRLDRTSTLPSLFTLHKTTHRAPYDAARSRVGIAQALPMDHEVLLVNPNGEITEASLCTPYFFRDGGWTTPTAASGGMQSVSKMLALGENFCSERAINADDIQDGELIWLSNALRGFFPGHIVRE